MTCSSEMFSNGCSRANVNISHKVTPNDHTSVLVENLPWKLEKYIINSLVKYDYLEYLLSQVFEDHKTKDKNNFPQTTFWTYNYNTLGQQLQFLLLHTNNSSVMMATSDEWPHRAHLLYQDIWDWQDLHPPS